MLSSSRTVRSASSPRSAAIRWPDTCPTPAAKPAKHRAPFPGSLRQIPPRSPGAGRPDDRVDEQRLSAAVTPWGRRLARQELSDRVLLCVRQFMASHSEPLLEQLRNAILSATEATTDCPHYLAIAGRANRGPTWSECGRVLLREVIVLMCWFAMRGQQVHLVSMVLM